MVSWILTRIGLYRKKAIWRKTNEYNFTTVANNFDLKKVTVGRMSYGNLYVVDFSSSPSKLYIGSYCSIAQGVKFLLGGEHNFSYLSSYPFRVKLFGAKEEAGSKGSIIVEDDVWIGENALICSGVTICQGSVVAAGSVVTKDVEPYSVVGGNPARLIRKRFDEETVDILKQIDIEQILSHVSVGNIDYLYTRIDRHNVRDVLSRFGGSK